MLRAFPRHHAFYLSIFSSQVQFSPFLALALPLSPHTYFCLEAGRETWHLLVRGFAMLNEIFYAKNLLWGVSGKSPHIVKLLHVISECLNAKLFTLHWFSLAFKNQFVLWFDCFVIFPPIVQMHHFWELRQTDPTPCTLPATFNLLLDSCHYHEILACSDESLDCSQRICEPWVGRQVWAGASRPPEPGGQGLRRTPNHSGILPARRIHHQERPTPLRRKHCEFLKMKDGDMSVPKELSQKVPRTVGRPGNTRLKAGRKINLS